MFQWAALEAGTIAFLDLPSPASGDPVNHSSASTGIGLGPALIR
jgi:hypothetical protein